MPWPYRTCALRSTCCLFDVERRCVVAGQESTPGCQSCFCLSLRMNCGIADRGQRRPDSLRSVAFAVCQATWPAASGCRTMLATRSAGGRRAAGFLPWFPATRNGDNRSPSRGRHRCPTARCDVRAWFLAARGVRPIQPLPKAWAPRPRRSANGDAGSSDAACGDCMTGAVRAASHL